MIRRSLVLLLAVLPLFAADAPKAPADLTTPPADAQKSEDGLVVKQLAAGKGDVHPTADDLVRLRYTVWKADGSLVQHVPGTQSLVIAVPKMIPGWGEAVKKMVVGEQQRSWIPPALNGGKMDLGLVIDTELLEIIPKPVAPADVAAPPADATKTESGLAYKVLRAGSGEKHPSRNSTVVVHYTGWQTDGRMIDSSVMRGTPTEFPLDAVIKGWTQGLQLMKVGEKTRFWIPANLAYGNDKSKPQGMLVFDIELISIR
ncbi:MAG TPA: FKBP-type peptidyl-prolyl cis-trans isomerase [Thermoanaerobaculia bacterium]|nr:FKBP-type peptidyl-prolyl cis-trans isomerase [Thermoanaerobaculia bacterium]